MKKTDFDADRHTKGQQKSARRKQLMAERKKFKRNQQPKGPRRTNWMPADLDLDHLDDWDGDGHSDLIVDSRNANVLRNEGTADGFTTFRDAGPVADRVLAGHSTCPTIVDWSRDGVPDLVIGAEDGRLYYLENPRRATQ